MEQQQSLPVGEVLSLRIMSSEIRRLVSVEVTCVRQGPFGTGLDMEAWVEGLDAAAQVVEGIVWIWRLHGLIGLIAEAEAKSWFWTIVTSDENAP